MTPPRRYRDARTAHETLTQRADPAEQRAAAIAVAARSHNAADAAELLAMLGLLCPPDSPSDAAGGPADLALGDLRERRSQALSEAADEAVERWAPALEKLRQHDGAGAA